MLRWAAAAMFASGRRHIGGFSGASFTVSRTRYCTRGRTGEGLLRSLRHQQLSGHASRAFTQYALHFRRALSARERERESTHSITTMVAQPKDEEADEPGKVQTTAATNADTLLIVESPVKATKIQKYLGSNFKVSALFKPACTSYTSTFHKHSSAVNSALLHVSCANRYWQAKGTSETWSQRLGLLILQQTSR